MKANKRNNQLRRALALALFFALLLPAAGAAFAAGDVRINLESANVSGGVLQLIFYSDAEEAPSLDSLQVSIDGTPVAADSVNTIDYADPGTSYLFLFDTNTAVTERALPDMQTIAKGIVERFGAQDSALIVPIGQPIDVRGFTDDKDALNASIDALTRGYGQTDLYTSVSEAVKLLENDTTLRPRRCLVVMADGLDNTAGGVSSIEVSTQVSQCHVPLYVVALTYSTGTQERIEAAKEISGIARLSPGGVSVLLKNDGVGTDDAVERILAQRAHTYLAAVNGEAARAAAKADMAEITLTQTTTDMTLSATRQVTLAGPADDCPDDYPHAGKHAGADRNAAADRERRAGEKGRSYYSWPAAHCRVRRGSRRHSSIGDGLVPEKAPPKERTQRRGRALFAADGPAKRTASRAAGKPDDLHRAPRRTGRDRVRRRNARTHTAGRRRRHADPTRNGGGSGENAARLAGWHRLGDAKQPGRSGQRRTGAHERLPEHRRCAAC